MLGPVHTDAIFWNAVFFYPDSRVKVAFNSGKQFKKDTSFGDLIHWFRVDERPIRVKKCGFKNTRIGVDVGLDNEQSFI